MAGSVVGLHVFAADTGPEALSLLDTNYSALTTAINTLQNYSNTYIDSGAVNALVVTVPAPQVFSYTDGVTISVKVAVTNTSAIPTINVNGLGNKNIVNPDGTSLAVGALVAGGWSDLRYDATGGNFQLLNQNANSGKFSKLTVGPPSSGTALQINVLDTTTGVNIQGNAPVNGHRVVLGDTSVSNRGSIGYGAITVTGGALTDFGVVATSALFLSANGGASKNFNISSAGVITGLGPVSAAQVDMTPDKGTFTPSAYAGFSVNPTGAISWVRVGNLVALIFPASMNGTSNATNFTITGLPPSIQPSTLTQTVVLHAVSCQNNSGISSNPALIINAGSSTMAFSNAASLTGWSAAGTKGFISNHVVAYMLS